MASILQDSLTRDLRSRAWADLVDRRFAIDATPIFVYWLLRGDGSPGPCPESALPYLLWQWDLTSPFWQLLLANRQVGTARDLIQSGISLHRIRGTKEALLRILDSLGWVGSEIQEGQDAWGGTEWPSDQGWAVVRIMLGQPDPSAQPAVIAWRPDTRYAIGDVVTFPGDVDHYYVAALPSLDVQPYYDTVDEVPQWDYLRDVDTLRTWQWDDSGTFRLLSATDLQLVLEAFDFAAPRRCLLDRVVQVLPGAVITSHAEWCLFAVGEIAVEPFICPGQPASCFVFGPRPGVIATESWTPRHDASYQHDAAITYAGVPVGDSVTLHVDGVLAVEGGSL